MAKTSSITLKTSSYDGRYVQAVLTQTKNIETNKNEIRYVISSLGGTYNYYSTGPIVLKYRTVNSDGTYGSWVTLKSIARVEYVGQTYPAFPCAKGSVAETKEISANNNGTCKIEVSLTADIYNSVDRVTTATWEMEDIPRAGTILTAENFTDEDNPTITYSNPAGNAVSSIQAGILGIDGATQYVRYREIPKTGSSYTFELTDEERQTLLEVIQNDTDNKPGEAYLRFYIKTYINDEIVGEPKFLQRYVYITNAIPEINITVKDIGAASTALTNDENTLIKGFNYVTASMTSTLKKGATIKEQSITNGSNKIEDDRDILETTFSTIFENVENDTFVFNLIDSYGQSIPTDENKNIKVMNMVPYVKLTCNIKANNPTADGDLAFRISGNYFNDKFGQNGVNNTLTVEYRIKENDGNYSAWFSTPAPTITNNTYSVDVTVSELNYRSAYTVQARAIDKVSTYGINSVERKVKSIPIFDWGEDDFAFNVPVNIDGALTVQGDTEITGNTNINGNFTINNEGLLTEEEVTEMIPTNLSQLINDVGFITKGIVEQGSGYIRYAKDETLGYGVQICFGTITISSGATATGVFGIDPGRNVPGPTYAKPFKEAPVTAGLVAYASTSTYWGIGCQYQVNTATKMGNFCITRRSSSNNTIAGYVYWAAIGKWE